MYIYIFFFFYFCIYYIYIYVYIYRERCMHVYMYVLVKGYLHSYACFSHDHNNKGGPLDLQMPADPFRVRPTCDPPIPTGGRLFGRRLIATPISALEFDGVSDWHLRLVAGDPLYGCPIMTVPSRPSLLQMPVPSPSAWTRLGAGRTPRRLPANPRWTDKAACTPSGSILYLVNSAVMPAHVGLDSTWVGP